MTAPLDRKLSEYSEAELEAMVHQERGISSARYVEEMERRRAALAARLQTDPMPIAEFNGA